MIRKLNFTGRKRINKTSVNIEILSENGFRYFDAIIDLSDYSLPQDAHVYVEAYHRSGYRRFNFGTIANQHKPQDRYLSGILETAIPLFRIKVVDKSNKIGRIIAAADKLRPRKINGQMVGENSLLYTVYEDIKERAWLLDLDEDWPTLKLNVNIPDIQQIASNDPCFAIMVYPEILRQVLYRIVVIDKYFDADQEDEWESAWLKMIYSLPGIEKVSEEYSRIDIESWIDHACEKFCKKNGFLETFVQKIAGDRF